MSIGAKTVNFFAKSEFFDYKVFRPPQGPKKKTQLFFALFQRPLGGPWGTFGRFFDEFFENFVKIGFFSWALGGARKTL